MATVARLYNNGELDIEGSINERLPAVTKGLIAHYPLDGTVYKYVPGQIRYIRDWLNFNTANNCNHWTEIEAFDYGNNNVALNKTAYANGNTSASCPALVDGAVNTTDWQLANMEDTVSNSYRTVDLGSMYNISKIIVWHYYGDGRTYHNTKTEVSDDGATWYSLFDSVIEGEYAETSAGHTINFESLGATCVPTASTCTLTNNCVAVEQATTNLWNGSFNIHNNYGVPATLTQISETYLGQSVYREVMTVDSAHSSYLSSFQTSLGSHGVYGSYRTYSANTTYAISIYWRPINKLDTVIGLTASNIGGWTDLTTYSIGDGWNRSVAYRDGTVTSDKSDNIYFSFKSPSLQLNETIYIDWCCPQIEQGRTYATSYVNGSRSDGLFNLSKALINPTSGTVGFLYNPLADVGSGYPDMAGIGWYSSPSTRDCLGVYHDASTWKNGISYNWYSKDGSAWGLSVGTSSDIIKYAWHYVVYSWDWNSKTAYVYLIKPDGTMLKNGGSVGLTSCPNFSAESYFEIGRLATGSLQNALYKNLSFYNIALQDNDIKKLANSYLLANSLSITTNGNIKSMSVNEKPNQIPTDAYYYQLGYNSYDKRNAFGPTTEINTAYNGSVWVGTSVANMYPNTDFGTTGTGIITSANYYNTCEFCYNYSQNLTWTYHGRSMTTVVNTVYRASMDVLITNDANIASTGTTFVADIEGGLSASFSYDNTKKGTWQHFDVIMTATTTSGKLYLYPSTSTIPATTGQLKWRNIMVTALPFTTCPTIIGRSDSYLAFNFNSSIGLDWSKDWSIVYWKKPIGTSDNTLTYFNIESLGCNSNSVGGGSVWWGKVNGANQIASTDVLTMDPTKYFGTWRMVSLQKTGTTITIKEWSPKEGIYTRAVTTTNSVSNYYVNQYGYDFKLGGWDNGNPCNSYYRDLIVVKNRCMTDAEVLNLYKTKMSINNSSIQIQNIFQENVPM